MTECLLCSDSLLWLVVEEPLNQVDDLRWCVLTEDGLDQFWLGAIAVDAVWLEEGVDALELLGGRGSLCSDHESQLMHIALSLEQGIATY